MPCDDDFNTSTCYYLIKLTLQRVKKNVTQMVLTLALKC